MEQFIWELRKCFKKRVKKKKRKKKYEATTDFAVLSALSLIPIITGLVFGIIASAKESIKVVILIMGVLLIGCGVLATVWNSYVSGPIYVLAGLLAVIAGLVMKRGKQSEQTL
ncbi:MAG: hypothetical protein ACOC7U_08585 [Spirochaetota bacterium]